MQSKNKFQYNEIVRRRKRQELRISDEIVFGHVGRLSYQKNHKFLVEIFNEIVKKNKNVLLLLIGVGEKENEVRKQVAELGLNEKVRFLGNRSDVFELYQAMDAFLLPSFFEGIPVVGVEAQYAGLPCFFSDKVPSEVAFNGKCSFVSLKDSANDWAECILRYDYIKGLNERNNESVKDCLYDIKNAYKMLENYYLDFKY